MNGFLENMKTWGVFGLLLLGADAYGQHSFTKQVRPSQQQMPPQFQMPHQQFQPQQPQVPHPHPQPQQVQLPPHPQPHPHPQSLPLQSQETLTQPHPKPDSIHPKPTPSNPEATHPHPKPDSIHPQLTHPNPEATHPHPKPDSIHPQPTHPNPEGTHPHPKPDSIHPKPTHPKPTHPSPDSTHPHPKPDSSHLETNVKQQLAKLSVDQRRQVNALQKIQKEQNTLTTRPALKEGAPSANKLTSKELTSLQGKAKLTASQKEALSKLQQKQPLTARDKIALNTALAKARGPSLASLIKQKAPSTKVAQNLAALAKKNPDLQKLLTRMGQHQHLTMAELKKYNALMKAHPQLRDASGFSLTQDQTNSLSSAINNPTWSNAEKDVFKKLLNGGPGQLSQADLSLLTGSMIFHSNGQLQSTLLQALYYGQQQQAQNAFANSLMSQGGDMNPFLMPNGGALPAMPCPSGFGDMGVLPAMPGIGFPNDPGDPDGPGVAMTTLTSPCQGQPTDPSSDGSGTPDNGTPVDPTPTDDGSNPDPTTSPVGSPTSQTTSSVVHTDPAAEVVANQPVDQDTRGLILANATSKAVTVHVRYHALQQDGTSAWFPLHRPGTSQQTLTFELAPGESVPVVDNGWTVRADRARVWAESGNTQWSRFRKNILHLVPEQGRNGKPGYRSSLPQNAVFTIR